MPDLEPIRPCASSHLALLGALRLLTKTGVVAFRGGNELFWGELKSTRDMRRTVYLFVLWEVEFASQQVNFQTSACPFLWIPGFMTRDDR